MKLPFLRPLLVLLAAGALVFSPVSERVSETSSKRGTDVSALVLLPTVEGAVGADNEGRTFTMAPIFVILQDHLAGLVQALLVLFVLLISPARAVAQRAAGPFRERAPPAPA